jgi:alpha-beta hydrolase superfamily lysophospholipase
MRAAGLEVTAGRPEVAGVVAAAGLHTVARKSLLKVAIARVLGGALPAVTVPMGMEPALLSRDPEVVRNYREDSLVHRRVSLGFARDLLDTIDRVLRDVASFPVPLLLIHGTADRVNFPSGSKEIAEKLGDRCTLHLYDGMFHQPHTDPDADRVFDDVLAWFVDHGAERMRAAAG